jgi:hypothetical protein
MMSRILMVVLAVALAGCAASAPKPVADSLRHERNVRTERLVSLTFPQIQQALFRHKAVCGTNYAFALEPGQTSYATIVFTPEPGQTDETPLLVDLVWYQGNLRSPEHVGAKVYSAYGSSAVSRRIDALFSALAKPEICRPASAS